MSGASVEQDVEALMGGAPQAVPRTAPKGSSVESDVDELLGGSVTTTKGGAAVSVGGRAQLKPREAGREGFKLDDIKPYLANPDAGPNDKTTASFGTLTKASMVDDPATKLRIFAEARFPGRPEKVQDYGFLGNEVVYIGDDGKLYRDTPAGISGGAAEFGASLVGKSAPIAGGAAGGFVAGGPVPSVLGAGLGAFGGEGVRKMLGAFVFDEPQTTAGNLKAMTTEGAFSIGGSLIGLGVAKYLNRHAAKDLAKLDRPAADALQANARRFDIDLTPGQATNLASVKMKEEALARMPDSADIMAEGMKRQAEQAQRAVDKLLAKISPVDGLDEAGTMAREGAKKVLTDLTVERANQARPLYQKAFTTFTEFSDEQLGQLARLRSSPSFKEAERLATRLLKDDLATMAPGQMPQAGALRDLHYTKLALDKMIGDSATGGYTATARAQLVGLKNRLLQVMDEASPAYKEARGTFAHLTPNIESVQDGVVSKVAKLSDEQAMSAARTMLGPQMSPKAVERARELFQRSGQGEAWDAIVRAHLQETFTKAGREFKSGGGPVGQAPAWRAMLAGDPAQKRVLDVALSSEQKRAVGDLMGVFEAMGRIRPANVNSITQPMEQATKAIQREAGSSVGGKVVALFSPQEIGGKVSRWLAEARTGAHAERLAQIVTSPDGMRQLRALSQMDPASQKALVTAAGIFGISIAPTAGSPQEQ